MDQQGDGCWLWLRSANINGYGCFGIEHGKSRLAHRVAWELTYGPIPDGLFVCHTCDVRLCVRPTHLFLGSHADNMADMSAKGRAPKSSLGQCGPLAPNAQLTLEQVIEIKSLLAAGQSQQRIADTVGKSQSTISLIARGKTWAEVGVSA